MMLRRYLGKKVGTPDSLPSSRASLCSAGGAMSRRAEHERARWGSVCQTNKRQWTGGWISKCDISAVFFCRMFLTLRTWHKSLIYIFIYFNLGKSVRVSWAEGCHSALASASAASAVVSSAGAGAAGSSAGVASAAGASSGALVSPSGVALAASPSLASGAGVSSLVSLAVWPFSSGLSSVVGEVASSFPSSLFFLLFFSEIPLNLKEFFRENFFFFLPSLAASPSALAASPSAAGAGSIASPAFASPSLAGSAVPFPSAAAASPSGLADTSPLVLTWPFSCRGREWLVVD